MQNLRSDHLKRPMRLSYNNKSVWLTAKSWPKYFSRSWPRQISWLRSKAFHKILSRPPPVINQMQLIRHINNFLSFNFQLFAEKKTQKTNSQTRTSANARAAQRSRCHARWNDHHSVGDANFGSDSIGWMEKTTLQIIFGKCSLLNSFEYICDTYLKLHQIMLKCFFLISWSRWSAYG